MQQWWCPWSKKLQQTELFSKLIAFHFTAIPPHEKICEADVKSEETRTDICICCTIIATCRWLYNTNALQQWISEDQKGNLLEWESKSSRKRPRSGPGSELSSLDEYIYTGKSSLISGGHLYSCRMLSCCVQRESSLALQF